MKNKIAVFLLSMLFPFLLHAEPYIAIREGLKCSACHENVTGGGKRTRFGAGFGAQDLPWQKVDLKANKIPFYWSLMNDLVSLGGDFRVLSRSIFVQNDTQNTFLTDKSNIYLSVKLLPNTLDFYLDESVAPGGAQSREIFAKFEKLPAHGWVKAGKFVQPYGLRLEDDHAFIREITGFTFDTPDYGAEIGFEPKDWFFAASITNGSAGSVDQNTGKQVVGSAAYIGDPFRVGVSASYNPAPSGNKNSGALWSGLRLGPAVLLGEADFIRDETNPLLKHDQIVTHAELDYLIHDGWNVKLAYEYFDPDRHIAENQRDRVDIGIESFLYPFMELQLFYRFNQSIPQNAFQNADELDFRLHVYF